MKKVVLTLSITLFVLGLGLQSAALEDLSGTWEGNTQVPDMFEPVKVTLVLKKGSEGYSGTITDSAGMTSETELEDVSYKENKLTAKFAITNPDGGGMTIYFDLEVEGNTMTGTWESEDGSSGDIELEKTE